MATAGLAVGFEWSIAEAKSGLEVLDCWTFLRFL